MEGFEESCEGDPAAGMWGKSSLPGVRLGNKDRWCHPPRKKKKTLKNLRSALEQSSGPRCVSQVHKATVRQAGNGCLSYSKSKETKAKGKFAVATGDL